MKITLTLAALTARRSTKPPNATVPRRGAQAILPQTAARLRGRPQTLVACPAW